MDNLKSQRVLEYIDGTVHNICRELHVKPYGKPSIVLKRIQKLKPQQQEDGQVKWEIESRQVTYSFPGKTKDEAWRFACLLRVLNEIHAAIHQDIIVTKRSSFHLDNLLTLTQSRDIYYRDPELFLKQDTVDRYVEDIAHTCDVQRSDLNVIASPKGLVVGLRGSSEPETVPLSISDRSLDHLRWILVVEKDATFQTLTDQAFHFNEHLGPGLIVTGKGYPDLATLRFLRMGVDHESFCGPIFGLFDFDPYGIEILRCYHTGSKVSLGIPQSRVPEIRWIGVKLHHVAAFDGNCPTLTTKDHDRAVSMLEAMTLESGDVVPGLEACRAELQKMLVARSKAEIQTVDSVLGLKSWLEGEMLADVLNAGR